MFEFRYSNMLTVLSVTFLYSGGMPILYPVAALFFFVSYWVDKCLILRCYRRPIKFDEYLAKSTLDFFKYILILHIIGFFVMFSLTPILQNSFLSEKQVSRFKIRDEDDQFSFFSIYLWICLIILIGFLIKIGPFNFCRNIIKRCCSIKRLNNVLPDQVANHNFEQDFYQCVSYGALKE